LKEKSNEKFKNLEQAGERKHTRRKCRRCSRKLCLETTYLRSDMWSSTSLSIPLIAEIS